MVLVPLVTLIVAIPTECKSLFSWYWSSPRPRLLAVIYCGFHHSYRRYSQKSPRWIPDKLLMIRPAQCPCPLLLIKIVAASPLDWILASVVGDLSAWHGWWSANPLITVFNAERCELKVSRGNLSTFKAAWNPFFLPKTEILDQALPNPSAV